MKLKTSVLFVIAVAALAAGCAAKPSLVGAWTAPGSAAYSFLPTGTFTVKQHMASGMISGEYGTGGTYTFSGGVLTLTTTSHTIGLDPSAQQAMMRRMQAINPRIASLGIGQSQTTMSVAPTSQVFQAKFKDGNTLDLTPSGAQGQAPPTELTRTAAAAPAAK